MFRPDQVHSLSEFQRNSKEFVERLSSTKQAELLTVNGKAALVIQDAESYKEMLELLETIKNINISASEFDLGKGVNAEKSLLQLKDKLEKK